MDYVTACHMLTAVIRQWIYDARYDPYERSQLKRFLELDDNTLNELLIRHGPKSHRNRVVR